MTKSISSVFHKYFSYPIYILYVLTDLVSPFSEAEHIVVGCSVTVLIIWWIFPTLLSISVPEAGLVSLYTSLLTRPPVRPSLCRRPSFRHFRDAAALLLDPAIETAGACLCVEMADIWRSSPSNRLTSQQIRRYRHGKENTHDLVIPTGHIFPARFVFPSDFKPHSSIFSVLQVHIIWSSKRRTARVSFLKSCCLFRRIKSYLPLMEPKVQYRLHKIKPLDHILT
jgi:hypothetical protein